MPRIISVRVSRNCSAVMTAPIEIPNMIVTMLASSFCAHLESRSTTCDSRSRLPNISMPMSEAAFGTSSPATIDTIIGKSILVRCSRAEMQIVHADLAPIRGCRQKANHRRLNDRHERHIRISGHRNRTEEVRGKAIGHHDGRRSVCGTNNTDRGRFLQCEPQIGREAQCEEDAELSGRPRTAAHLQISQERSEIDHRPMATKISSGNSSVRMPKSNSTVRMPGSPSTPIAAEKGILARIAQANRQQQRRFVFLRDGQPDQHAPNQEHDPLPFAETHQPFKHLFHGWLHTPSREPHSTPLVLSECKSWSNTTRFTNALPRGHKKHLLAWHLRRQFLYRCVGVHW